MIRGISSDRRVAQASSQLSFDHSNWPTPICASLKQRSRYDETTADWVGLHMILPTPKAWYMNGWINQSFTLP